MAAERLHHNAILAFAVIMFMLSNHFPLVYGHAHAWMAVPSIVVVAWLIKRLLSTQFFLERKPSIERQRDPQANALS